MAEICKGICTDMRIDGRGIYTAAHLAETCTHAHTDEQRYILACTEDRDPNEGTHRLLTFYIYSA